MTAATPYNKARKLFRALLYGVVLLIAFPVI